MSTVAKRRILWRVAVAAALVAIALAAYRCRRQAVMSLFVDARTGGEPPVLPTPDDPALADLGLAPTGTVRVVLIDGVGRDVAHTMPTHDRLCDRGLDLTVDVGFPTVSLPVQHALWTGLTQQQSGILYRIERLEPPPLAGIPAQVPDSIAVAEKSQYIVHSLGFASALPPDPDEAPDDWREGRFAEAAREAVASDARLAFVHVLRVDVAGHHHGADSDEYRTAAATSDRLLADLLAAAPPDARWFVLSDHGHTDTGGHGGAEPAIRRIRGCIAGAPAPPVDVPPGSPVHLVDYSRAIADSLDVRLSSDAPGRPLYAAVTAPDRPDATLPSPSIGRFAGAGLVLLVALLATGWAARGRWSLLPWWWPVAYLSVLVIHGAPTLSTPMIYKPLGRTMYVAALPGLCVLAVCAALALRRSGPLRVAIAELALPLGSAAAALVLCGGVHVVLGVAGDPPLMPRWTAHASLFAVLVLTGTLVVALAALASAVRIASGRDAPPETDRSAA